jgi:hypothetical protein
MPNVPPPSCGLGSDSNYFLNNNGNNLNGVATTIDVSTDIVASDGFGFQFNCYSPEDETCTFQQYAIIVDTSGQMTSVVNNYAGKNASTSIIDNWVSLHKLPSATLRAGCQCRIALQNDPDGNVTAATYTVRLLSVGPATGSGLDGYKTSNNNEHVNYIGADNHVHELVYTDQWASNDLTQITGAPDAAPGSALAGYQTSNNNELVTFIGADNHVYELVYTNHWASNDLTQITGAPDAAPGSALAGYQTSNNNEHVIFIGVIPGTTDNHVYELVHTNHWEPANDLTGKTGAPDAAPGSALAGYQTSNNNEHVIFIGTDGHVHELVYTNHWEPANDLTGKTGAPNAAPGSALAGYQTSNNHEHVIFIGTDGHVHELVYTNNWGLTDLNNVVLANLTQTISSAHLSPIVAFELDIVGYDNSHPTTLSSGSGTITYTAANAMTVANAEPSYCAFDGGSTETANTAYGELPTGSSATFVQTFATSTATIKCFKRNAVIMKRPSAAG